MTINFGKICTSIGFPDEEKCLRACDGEEMVEIRADLCGFTPEETAALARKIACPVIVTYRGPRQNRFLARVLEESSPGEIDYIDLEMEAPKSYSDEIKDRIHSLGGRFIVSFHDFSSTPCTDELAEIYDICVSRGADIVKIVTTAADIEDASAVMRLYRKCSMKKPLVAFCMGEAGRFTRLLCMAAGAPHTYCAAGAGALTAEGQFTSARMRVMLDAARYPHALRKVAFSGGPCTVPSSKSQAQRAIVAAALGRGITVLRGYGACEDTEAAVEAVRALGAAVTVDGDSLIIGGVNIFRASCREIFTGESGLLTRLMIPLGSFLTLHNGEVTVRGGGTLIHRDMSETEEAMKTVGVDISGGRVPFTIRGALDGGEYTLDGSKSSQIISGLLMALPMARKATMLTVEHPVSTGYLRMTLEVLHRFGIMVELIQETPGRLVFWIPGRQRYRAVAEFFLEADWSSAAYLLVAEHIGRYVGRGAGCGAEPLLKDGFLYDKLLTHEYVPYGNTFLHRGTVQADERIMDVLRMCGPGMKSFDFDATDCPDLFPVLAVLACFCHGTSTIRGVGRLRSKESDRAEAIFASLTALGAVISVRDGVMHVTGGPLHGGYVSSYHDHRMAMSLAVAAAFIDEDVYIDDISCAGKSYPGFFF